MAKSRKVIITCAVTGSIHTPSMSPHLPVTAQEIADAAIGAAEAGAAIVHLHARNPQDGRPDQTPEAFAPFLKVIKQRSGVVVNITTGGAPTMTAEERVRPAATFKPEVASLNMGTMNFGLYPMIPRFKGKFKHDWEEPYLERSRGGMFKNTFADIEYILTTCAGNGTRFEIECYDIGHLYTLRHFLDRGLVKPPLFVQSVFGILGGIGPHPEDVMMMKRTADAVALIQKAIAAKTAAGQKPDESWYKRAVALAYNANLAISPTIAREWVSAYPSPKNWRDAIRIYQTSSKLDDSSLLDSMRLAQATGSLSGENDYFRFTNTLVNKGFAGEAKMVLEQGFAANSISKSKPTFSQLYAVATAKSQGDRASLGASAAAALAAPDARKAMVTADAYYGYGDYSKAAELYRAALGKSGVDKDLANLRLGMSLVRAGDKAGATAALNAAGGAQAEVAKFWLAYLATKA